MCDDKTTPAVVPMHTSSKCYVFHVGNVSRKVTLLPPPSNKMIHTLLTNNNSFPKNIIKREEKRKKEKFKPKKKHV